MTEAKSQPSFQPFFKKKEIFGIPYGEFLPDNFIDRGETKGRVLYNRKTKHNHIEKYSCDLCFSVARVGFPKGGGAAFQWCPMCFVKLIPKP